MSSDSLQDCCREEEVLYMSPAIRSDEAEAGGSFGQEGEPSKASHAYGLTSVATGLLGAPSAAYGPLRNGGRYR
jgi:hypothetical protein